MVSNAFASRNLFSSASSQGLFSRKANWILVDMGKMVPGPRQKKADSAHVYSLLLGTTVVFRRKSLTDIPLANPKKVYFKDKFSIVLWKNQSKHI